MAGRCGPWDRCLAMPAMRDCGAPREDSFKLPCPRVSTFSSPRAWAFSILGLQAYLDWFPGDRAMQNLRNMLANRLLDIYERSHSDSWHWFEKSLSYSNARLSQALILAGWRSNNQRMIAAGIESLEWLVAAQHRDEQRYFVPIGSNGFFAEGRRKLASISSRLKPALPSPLVLMPTG